MPLDRWPIGLLRAFPASNPQHARAAGILRYAIVALVCCATLAFRIFFLPVPSEGPYLVVYIWALLFAAYVGGFRTGLLATAIIALGSDYFTLLPLHAFYIANGWDLYRWLTLIALGVSMSLIVESLHRTREKATEAAAVHTAETKKLNEALQLALDVSQTRVWTWDPEADVVTFAGYHPDSSEPDPDARNRQGFLSRIHPDDRAYVEDALSNELSSGNRLSLAYRIFDENEDLRWVSNHGQMKRGEDGKPIVVGAWQDITDQKRAELELAESRAQFEAVVQSAMDPIMTVDIEQKVVLFNRAAEIAFRRDAKETLGQPIGDLVPERFRNQLGCLAEAFGQADGVSLRVDSADSIIGLRTDGSEFPFEASLSLNTIGNRKLLTIALRDLSDKIRAEKALQQMEASKRLESLGRMTGGIAHDFNNLLTVITGNIELVRAETTDLRLRRLLLEAEDAVSHGARLNTNLMTFARQRSLAPAATDLNDQISPMRDMIQRALGETVIVKTNLSASACVVFIDPSELQSALLNLALNAFDAMPNGGDLIMETSVVSGEAIREKFEINDDLAAEYVRISVSDTGHGMTAEVRARAFEPFFTTRDVGKGTGLGLATIYGFVKQSGGEIAIYSEAGKGTAVNMYFPRVASQPSRAPRRGAEDREISKPTGLTILLVEDNEAVRRITRERLKSLGYGVIEAANGNDAAWIIESNPHIDILFSDIVMPGGLSGYEVARKMLGRYPHARILLTSGFNEEIASREGAGMERLPILRKPYSTADLAAALRSAFEKADA